ncbi:MAG TPA: hypothetical protein VEI83_13975 [Acidimicrobiales bacterium]|nr:hypothetical protein [Acidimicrobiales bacterium]
MTRTQICTDVRIVLDDEREDRMAELFVGGSDEAIPVPARFLDAIVSDDAGAAPDSADDWSIMTGAGVLGPLPPCP